MIQISFEINGKKINPNNIKDALETSILSSVQKSIKKSVYPPHLLDAQEQGVNISL